MPFRNSNLGGCDGNENAACEEFLDGLLRCLTQQLHVKDSPYMITNYFIRDNYYFFSNIFLGNRLSLLGNDISRAVRRCKTESGNNSFFGTDFILICYKIFEKRFPSDLLRISNLVT